MLRLPAVADKTFLITIGDRTVGGLISRDQLVGPVAGAGERCRGDARRLSRRGRRGDGDGRAHAGGGARCAGFRAAGGRRGDHQHTRRRHRIAVADPPVGQLDGRLRRAGRGRGALRDGARGGEGAVSAARHRHSGRQGLAVDEDRWSEGGVETSVIAPVSLIVSAFAPVRDVRRTLTPVLQLDERPTSLWLIDLGGGRNRLGGSALAQVYGELGEEPADLDRSAAAHATRRRARRSCAPPACCAPTTIAPTAGCS